MKFLYLTCVVIAVPSCLGSGTCSDVESVLWDKLNAASLAMEPQSVLAATVREALAAERQCPDSEPLAYIRLRASELKGKSALPSRPDPTVLPLAEDMSQRFPKSGRIATLVARLDGSIKSAQRAVSIDARYIPAKVALASAYLASGNPEKARAVIADVRDLGKVADGFTVQSRIYLASGDTRNAIRTANEALGSRDAIFIEPDARDPEPIALAHETLGLAFLQRHQYDRAAEHLLAAAPLSARAKSIIDSAGPQLEEAVKRQQKR